MTYQRNVTFADRITALGVQAKQHSLQLNARLAKVTQSCTDIVLERTVIRTDLYHVRHFEAGSGADWHRHPFMELTWVEGGPIRYESSQGAIELDDGEFFIMPAFTPHRWHVETGQTILHGFMLTVLPISERESSLVPRLSAAAAAMNYKVSPSPSVISALRQAEAAVRQSDKLGVVAAAGYLRAGLASLLGHVLNTAPTQDAYPTEAAAPALPAALERAVTFITSHLAEPLDVPTIAAHVQLSTRQLDRMFHAAFDMPTGAFLLHTRLERAGYLLSDSDLSIKQIAGICGFTEANYFSRIFRKRNGQSPREYRAQR